MQESLSVYTCLFSLSCVEYNTRENAREGKGKIGKSGFANFMNDPRFAGVPMILETPKGVDGRGTDLDKVNLKRLRTMARVATERRWITRYD